MKTHFKHLFPLPALVAGFVLMLAGPVTAQVFKTLHTFTGGSDGASPFAGLILSGSALYGTAVFGGSSGYGTLFVINTNGTGFKVLESFNGGNNEAYPETTLLLSGNTLYGGSGGPGAQSTLFVINTNGTGFRTLYTFTPISGPHYTNSDGCVVAGTLSLSGNTLYGASDIGGSGGNGTVFAVNTNGTGFTTLHSFTATSVPRHGTENPPYPNSDGAGPASGVILSGNTLYGTTQFGGTSGWGTVFTINTNGMGFTNLYVFTGGSDGGWPYLGPLILSGNTLYGTTMRGGSGSGNSGNGTVFALNTDGTGFTNLHIFTATNSLLINSDGAAPSGGLILSGNTLYGTTVFGGSLGNGTVFAVNTDGTGFMTLHNFAGRPSLDTGLIPSGGGLILSGSTLYGTTYSGGTYGDGTVFSLSFRPQLTIIPSGTNVILTWPTNYAGFDYTGYTLQSTTNLGSSAVWTTNSPAPIVVNGQNVVTNSITGTQQFFRLTQ
jgi:uncharacterized repeat protein (TIGR03803 family)